MASFADAEGRVWHLDLDLVTADEIKAAKGLDLIDPEKMSETFLKLAGGSTRLLVEVCWMLVYQQAEKMKPAVSPEEFGRAMKPRAVADAYVALKESIADFFQLNPAAAEGIRRVWSAAEGVAKEFGDQALAKLDEKLASAATALRSESSATNTPASSATSAV